MKVLLKIILLVIVFQFFIIIPSTAWAIEDVVINSQTSVISLQGQSNPTDKPEAIAIPRMFNYQGKLTDAAGNPVRDSTYSITFRLFNVSSGGVAFWNETQNVQTNNGLFNILLGSLTPIDSIPQDGNCYLEMQVNPNPAMRPRIRVVSSAYAYQSRKADSTNYASLSRKADSANYASLSRYADSASYAVSASIIRPITPQIYSAEIRDTTIIAGKIKDGAVTMAKIDQSGATTGQVIKWTGTAWAPRNDSAGGPPIGPAGGDLTGTYPNPTIANNAVNSAKIADREVTNADLAENAVTTSKITDANVTLAKISPTGSSAGQAIISTGSSTPPTWGSVSPGPHNHLGETWTTATIDRGLLMKLNLNTSSIINGFVDSVVNAGTGSAYGAQIYAVGTGTGPRYGIFTQASCPSGSGSGATGIYSSGASDGTGIVYGGYFYAGGSGTGTKYGVNSFVAGPSKMYGVRSSASPSSAATDSGFGVYGSCSHSGSGKAFGGFFNADGSGAGAKYGLIGNADAGSSVTTLSIGVSGTCNHNGTGTAYGGSFTAGGDGTGGKYGVSGFCTAPSGSSNHGTGVYGYGLHYGTGIVIGGNFIATASGSGKSYGVIGNAAGSGDTVFGAHATSSSSGSAPAIGVRGRSSISSSGDGYGSYFNVTGNGTGRRYGVYSYVTAPSGSSQPAYGYSGLVYHSGSGSVYGASFEATGTGTGDRTGVRGYAQISSGSSSICGVYGFGTHSGSGSGYGGRFYIGGGTGIRYGVHIDANGSGSLYGVYATAFNSSGSATTYGGYFKVTNTTGNNTGVYGEASGSYSNGVYGRASGEMCNGVYGIGTGTGNDGSAGGYFQGGQFAAWFQGFTVVNGDLLVNEDFYVVGSKSAVVKISEDNQRLVYCQESPEVWFEDFGEGQLREGKADIQLDPTFLKTVTISEEHPMKVFVQLNDDCNGVYVKRGNTSFSVIELNNGKSNAHFTYRVVAKRKGYENVRLEKLESDINTNEIIPESLRYRIKMKVRRNK